MVTKIDIKRKSERTEFAKYPMTAVLTGHFYRVTLARHTREYAPGDKGQLTAFALWKRKKEWKAEARLVNVKEDR